MNKHKFDIAHFPKTFTKVSEHFNSPGHSIQKEILCLLILLYPHSTGGRFRYAYCDHGVSLKLFQIAAEA